MSFVQILRAAMLVWALAGATACQSTSGSSDSTSTGQKAGEGY